MSPAIAETEIELRLEDLRIETFATSAWAEGTDPAEMLTTTCSCSSCDVTASGSVGTCTSGCGTTSCKGSEF
jgi:hypothetical protein